MERFKALMSAGLDVAKIFGVVTGILGLFGGVIHCAVWLSNRADAMEVAILKSQRADDHEILMFVARTVAGISGQMNHQAETGRPSFVQPPPAPPEVASPILRTQP